MHFQNQLAIELEQKPLEYLQSLSEGKITIGVSDYSKNASRRTASSEALKLKKILVRHGRSVRVVENKEAVLSTATSLHNGLGGKNERKVEFIKVNDEWFRVIGVQDIEAYAKRDQARPARDAKVGMLPPKLAQVLINLCGPLASGSVVLDPFCGTGVVLQESLLMGYRAYGTGQIGHSLPGVFCTPPAFYRCCSPKTTESIWIPRPKTLFSQRCKKQAQCC